ncbi:hypothetical protein, partial [Streptomyces caniscabiei]|uniref:hypothetical protein n=1 Tax=Streptomyces caniscabiei TaxID=2746961 RepID=UPI001C4EFF17
AWTWLRKDRRSAVDRLKNVWKRRRKNRDQPATPTTPAVADTVRRPTTHTAPTSTPGGTMSGGHHFVAAATEMARAAAAYQPTGMLQVGQDFTGLEEAQRIHAEALKTTVENADANWPPNSSPPSPSSTTSTSPAWRTPARASACGTSPTTSDPPIWSTLVKLDWDAKHGPVTGPINTTVA